MNSLARPLVALIVSFVPFFPLAAAPENAAEIMAKTLDNVKLSGYFTVTGKDKPPKKESYIIPSVAKAPGDNDLWIIDYRFEKGGKTVDLPLPLPVKWAGDKPVIYMDNLTIPGLGTFSAFVLFDDGKYAGTWAHGKTTGHLYGTLAKREGE